MNDTKPKYEYGTLTEDFLKALPAKPMSLGESLCGDSKASRRCRELGRIYGTIAQPAMLEAMRIKYATAATVARTGADGRGEGL